MRRTVIVFVFVFISAAALAQVKGNFTSQGRYEISRGRYASAIEMLNRSIEQSGFNSEAYFLRGIAKYELDDFIGADKDFGKAIELNPRNHEAFLYRGVCRSQQLNYKDAFADYNQAVKLNDEDWRVYSNRSLASLQLDRFVDVISDCNKIIELKKENSYTYLVRGEAKAGLEMYNVAIEDFERAIKLDSTSMRPVLHRGIAKAKLKDFKAAIIDFEIAMTKDSSSALPIYHRGTALAEIGKMKEALADFNEVLRQYPDNTIVLFNRAMVYSDMKKMSDALADYDRVIKLNPANILGFYNRGNLRLNQRNYQGALEDFNKAIALFPEFIEAHENRVEAYRLLKNRQGFDAAVAELENLKRALSVFNDDAKYEQTIKLLKLTELKGDFEPVQQEVGKVQHQKVDVRLLPFYRLSVFPETDKNIAVYDGFNRPFYSTGIMAFITKKEEPNKRTNELLQKRLNQEPSSASQLIELAYLRAISGDYEAAYESLSSCFDKDEKQVACYFARASLLQMELETRQEDLEKLVGSLDVKDMPYQAKTESLLARAEADYRKVIELDKEMSFAHFNLGHLLASAERYEEAETQFGLAASSRGNFIEANFNRGLIRILLGKMEKGCEDMSLAGELGLTDSYNVIKRYCE